MEPWHYYGFVTFSIPFLSMKMQTTKDSGTSIHRNGFRWFSDQGGKSKFVSVAAD